MLPLQVNTLPMAQSASQHGLPFSLPAVKPPTQNLELLTDGLLFNISLDSFNEYRSGQPVDYLDWTSDGCTQSPESPLGFNFFPACHRHDFGYQNYINVCIPSLHILKYPYSCIYLRANSDTLSATKIHYGGQSQG